MIEFTNDEAVRADLEQHAAVFEYCRSVLEFSQEPIEAGLPLSVARGDGVDEVVVWVSMTQYVKLWRLAATVVRLAQCGDAYEAMTLVRSMYEVALLLEFVLRRQVHPKQNGKRLDHGQRPFSSSFRAKMYVAHTALRRSRWAQSASTTRGLRRQLPASLLRRLEEEARPLEELVGVFWAKRLRRDPTGLSLAVLSETLGAKKLYESFYRARSTSAHASDIERFVEESGCTVSLCIAPETDVPQILGESIAFLLRGAYWVAKRIRVLDLETCEDLLAQLSEV